MNQYRCETCSHYLKYAIACNKIKERLIVGADEWIEKVGCASHSGFRGERDKVLDYMIKYIDEHPDAVYGTATSIRAELVRQRKTNVGDVCSECGSHCGFTEIYKHPDTVIGTRYCALCGNKKPMVKLQELRQKGKDGERG